MLTIYKYPLIKTWLGNKKPTPAVAEQEETTMILHKIADG